MAKVTEILANPSLLDDGGDFYAGEIPKITRITARRSRTINREIVSTVVAEWEVTAESVVYRHENQTLYVCSPTKIL